MIDPAQKKKRLEDEIAGAKAGFDTSAEDDARLRQSYPEPDEHTEQAERTANSLSRDSNFRYMGIWKDPAQRKEFVENLARKLRGEKDPPRMVAPPSARDGETFSKQGSDEFWSNPEELQKAAKQVRPTKL